MVSIVEVVYDLRSSSISFEWESEERGTHDIDNFNLRYCDDEL